MIAFPQHGGLRPGPAADHRGGDCLRAGAGVCIAADRQYYTCSTTSTGGGGAGTPNGRPTLLTTAGQPLHLGCDLSGAETETNSPAGQPPGPQLRREDAGEPAPRWADHTQDIAARKTSATITGPSSGVTCVAFGHSGVLTGGFLDGTVTLRDTVSGRSIAVLTTGTNSAVSSLTFSPDGAFLASMTRKLTVCPLEQ
ncbi:hypothetical protein [Streptomyces sp. NPDC046925]|uniref:WD40 repeat domain-containing protein n=1 Tax=Streptomyces sp. NPDC046925 TaxID=3155375 RepID=UPI003410B1E6